MGIQRTTLVALAFVGMLLVGGQLSAQTSGDEPDVDSSVDAEANVSPKEMTDRSEQLVGTMKMTLRRVLELQQSARKQKDIIKLNCVNDKLLQLKQLLNIAESARTDLVEAIANRDDNGRYHQFSRITVAAENSSVLRDEAEACIGEELIFVGETELEVEEGDVQDDPTGDDPFDVPIDYEDVSVASPFK